ncbi:4-alpha-glucanotransferase [Oceanidesulfovibrio marinus]|uniref:4-alpha-glucanotransferase n=1 Tax=Oceanidesulfovibrio marinus TaxID=370038 RepID=A0A6P1ZBY7_9BACT|nr:4-alpha-glucanotransferase [Oceanidesulfovibrio marinus]TVM31596.1 4-alpha-glucanotransferase [Oceanidesulfovibrio marinus]
MQLRGSGILMHVSSLPSGYGIGDAGPKARAFVDLLAKAKQRYWQILPLGPTSTAIGNSPYSSFSAFAGNPLLISPEEIAAAGILQTTELGRIVEEDPTRVNYDNVQVHKETLLHRAFDAVENSIDNDPGFQHFCTREAHWLEDYALFVSLKEHFGGAMWTQWPVEYRDRNPGALQDWRGQSARLLQYERFVQYLFQTQWLALKEYANSRGVRLIGDMPIYVTFDSADVWANPGLFKLDNNRQPYVVAGVPPDFFSATGQLWGNPIYDWQRHQDEGFDWWIRRLARTFQHTDSVRLDHFRGFAAYWEVPADHETAQHGSWVEAPGEALFATLYKTFNCVPIIAEDLGVITADVRELKDRFGFPGMKVLLFAFGDNIAQSPYIPHAVEENSIIYTGTHDNNTFNGWFFGEASQDDKERFKQYCGLSTDPHHPHRHAIRLAMTSVSRTALFPMQDVFGLGSDSRMNVPAVAGGNWTWRMRPEDLDEAHAFDRGMGFLEEMTRLTNRD